MVKNLTITLTDFSKSKNRLLGELGKKIDKTQVTALNEVFDKKFKIQYHRVNDLLQIVEVKFKRCEMVYFSYLRDVDYDILKGILNKLPFEMRLTHLDGTSVLEYSYQVNEPGLYRDLVYQNFQTFILTLASLYENLVILMETILKKVIVFVQPPRSSPLHDYVEFLDRLLSLGYRKEDKLSICIKNYHSFFSKYLVQINGLRNYFIHGYKLCIDTDGDFYFVEKIEKSSFVPRSAELQLDVFCGHVIDRTRDFIGELLATLGDTIKHYKKSIPA